MQDYAQDYQGAISAIEQLGWIQGTWHSDAGVCLLGAISVGRGYRPYTEPPANYIPAEMAEQILHKLRWKPTIIFAKIFEWADNSHNVYNIIGFYNDAPWRRKKSVIKVLKKLSKQSHKLWLQDELSQLRIKVARLEADKKLLEFRINELEKENSWLKKHLGKDKQLEEDRLALENLDKELKEAFTKIEELV